MNINDKIADLERQIAALKAEAAKPVVEYRAAEWPRDAGRKDAEFSDDGEDWDSTVVFGCDGPVRLSDGTWQRTPFASWRCCRVPITYRTPSLPEDAGKVCEFSDDGQNWILQAILVGYQHLSLKVWQANAGEFHHCRIKD